jgi:hypothetical protein
MGGLFILWLLGTRCLGGEEEERRVGFEKTTSNNFFSNKRQASRLCWHAVYVQQCLVMPCDLFSVGQTSHSDACHHSVVFVHP